MTKPVYVGKNNRAILDGEVDLSTWSEEELIRGQRRSVSGRWHGRPPKVVPKALHDELVKRKMTKAYDLLNESIYDAVAVLVDVATDKAADPAVRVKAAAELLNRTMGKPTEKVQIGLGLTPLFEMNHDQVVLSWDGDVVDAEVVDDGTG